MTVAQVKHPVDKDAWVPAKADLLLDTLVQYHYADITFGPRQLAARIRTLTNQGLVRFVEVTAG